MIKVVGELDDDLFEQALGLYDDAFRELDQWTVQRHLMTPVELADVLGDPRIDKYVALDDGGRMVGLATYTNILEAWPLISPAYFRRRWPDKFAARKVWYCGFVAVPGHERGVFAELVTALYRHAEEHGGVIALDVCRYNIERYHLDRAIRIMLNGVSGGRVRCEEADAQTFQIYETAPVG